MPESFKTIGQHRHQPPFQTALVHYPVYAREPPIDSAKVANESFLMQDSAFGNAGRPQGVTFKTGRAVRQHNISGF